MSKSIQKAIENNKDDITGYISKYSVILFEVYLKTSLFENISITCEKRARKAGELNPLMGPMPVN